MAKWLRSLIALANLTVIPNTEGSFQVPVYLLLPSADSRHENDAHTYIESLIQACKTKMKLSKYGKT